MSNSKSPATNGSKFNLRRETVKSLQVKSHVNTGFIRSCISSFGCEPAQGLGNSGNVRIQ